MLQEYVTGSDLADRDDPYPELGFSINVNGLGGPLLETKYAVSCDFYMSNGKTIYRYCVKAFNKMKLNGQCDTVWRDKLKVGKSVSPVWRVFYKAPLNKRSGDLQWRILHGALAVIAFIAKINPRVQ